MKKTILNEWHKNNGGKLVPFAGWEMPVQYKKGLREEHEATRKSFGLFDVSHMGEFRFKGKEALKAVSYFSPTDISKLKEGESCYTFFANEKGGVVDDLLVYCFEEGTDYLICVNASNTDKIGEHIQAHNKDFNVEVINECEIWGQVAVQGPRAIEKTEMIIPGVKSLKRFSFGMFDFNNTSIMVARTGYTGEDGFEIFVPTDKTEQLWKALVELGGEPCGLGARDTLRLEAALNLYGNELDDECNPFERRLGWTINLDTETDFIGKSVIKDAKKKATKKLVGLMSLDRAIPRSGYKVGKNGNEIGYVTSGTFSPTLNKPIGIALVDKEHAKEGDRVEINIRNRQVEAEVVKLPFYKA